MRYRFDLLTRPVFDDETIETGANIHRWKNARDFVVTVAPEVEQYFVLEDVKFDPPHLSVRAHRTGPCPGFPRFAAIVECETDEEQPQERPDRYGVWPSLIVSRDVDPPFRNAPPPSVGGTTVWEQIQAKRNELLSAFDTARTRAKRNSVQTSHGPSAEAEIRRWLAEFLPKRFGVTSGFVVSPGQRGRAKFPHFDVIIYDILEAPVLWIDGSPDDSEAGKARAILVEHVRAVLEVKSTFGASEAKAAMDHLRELAPYYAARDSPGRALPEYLPAHFFSALVFFDAPVEGQRSEAARRHLIPAGGPPNFYGAVILRGEGRAASDAAQLRIASNQGTLEVLPPMWGSSMFQMFAFDLVALLRGTYRAGYSSAGFFAIDPAVLGD